MKIWGIENTDRFSISTPELKVEFLDYSTRLMRLYKKSPKNSTSNVEELAESGIKQIQLYMKHLIESEKFYLVESEHLKVITAETLKGDLLQISLSSDGVTATPLRRLSSAIEHEKIGKGEAINIIFKFFKTYFYDAIKLYNSFL